MSGAGTSCPVMSIETYTSGIPDDLRKEIAANQVKIRFSFPHKDAACFNAPGMSDEDKARAKIEFLRNTFEFDQRSPFDAYVKSNPREADKKSALLIHILRNKLEDLVANAMDEGSTELVITMSSPFDEAFSPETVSDVVIEDNGSGFPGFSKSKYPMFETYEPSTTRSTKQGAQKGSHVGGCGKALKIIHNWIAEDAIRTHREGEFAFDKGNRGRKDGARLHLIYQSPEPLSALEFDQIINPDHHLSSASVSAPSTPPFGVGAGVEVGFPAVASTTPDDSVSSASTNSGSRSGGRSSTSLISGSSDNVDVGPPPPFIARTPTEAASASSSASTALKTRLGGQFVFLSLRLDAGVSEKEPGSEPSTH